MATKAEHIKTQVHIQPSSGWAALRLGELWEYRELVGFLTWRTILVRYKQAVMGIAWAVLQPVLTMIVFTLVFGRFMGASSKSYGVPYAIFLYSGLLPWGLFASGVLAASQSLVQNANLLTKVYFPRLIIPLSAILAGLVDFAIAFVVLIVLMIIYRIAPTWNVLWLAPLTVLAVLATLAVSLWLSAFNVIYRDVQYIVPFRSADLDVPHASLLRLESSARRHLAGDLRLESNGRSDSGLSLGAARWDSTELAGAGLGDRDVRVVRGWSLLLQAHRARLR